MRCGVLTATDFTSMLRIVDADLLLTFVQSPTSDQGLEESVPVTLDIKTVSPRLRLRPAEIRKAYEKLESLGGVHIIEKRFPPRHVQQTSLLSLNMEPSDKV